MSALVQQTDVPRMPTLAPPPRDVWAWWQYAKRGSFGHFDPLAPQQGLYRFRPRKSDRGQPARIWFDASEDQWIAEVSGTEIEDVVHVWRYSHQNPIGRELYEAVMSGGAWPDEIEEPERPATIGHNSRRPEEEIRDEIASADAAFSAWLKEQGGAISNEEADAKADAFAKRFLGFEKRIKEAHQTAKAPILEESRRIDAAWITGPSSIKSYAEACKKRVLDLALPYRAERKRMADEAARKAREEADKIKAKQAEERARVEAEGRTYVPAQALPSSSYTPKKAAGVVERKVAVIDDLPKVVAQLASMKPPRPDFVDLVQRIAEQMLKAGAPVDGAHLGTELRAR